MTLFNIKPSLILCISGIAIWLAVFIIMNSKISGQKKILRGEGKGIPKAETSFGASLSLTILVELLPILIPMKFLAETIACVCGILGAYIVLNERLINLKKAGKDQ